MQRPHPPIWIPGGGSVETWQWCAEMDYVYCYLSYYGYKAGQATMDGFWNEMARLGKDRNPYRAGFLQFVGVGESRQQAIDLYSRSRRVFLRPLPACRSALGDAAGLRHRKRRSAPASKSQVQQAAGAGHRATAGSARGVAREMEAIVDRGYVIIGSPDEVVEQLREVATQPERRPPDAAVAVRQHEQGADQATTPSCSPSR